MPSVVQSTKANGTGVTLTATFGVGTTSGNAVVAILVHTSGFINQLASTGPTGFTYVGTQAWIANSVEVDAWYKDSVTPGSTAFSVSGQNSVEKTLYIFEVSGADIPSLDVATINSGTSAAPTATTPAMNRGAELVFMATGSTQTTAITADAGATGSLENHDVNGSSLAQYKALASGAFGATQTLNAGLGSSIKWAASILTLRAAPGTLKTINPTGTGTVSIIRLKVHPLSITVVGTKSVALIRTINKRVTVSGTGVAKASKARIRKIFVASSQKLKVLKGRFRTIPVVGTGTTSVLRARCKQIFVAGTSAVSLSKIRAVLISVAGTGVVKQTRTHFRIIKVVGTGIASSQIARLRSIVVAGTGAVHVIRTRLRKIAVVGTHAITLSYLRPITIFVAGTSLVNVINSRIIHMLIKAMNTGSVVRISRHITKGISVVGSHSITIKTPRFFKKLIAVTGTSSVVLNKLKSIFGVGHKTRFTISAEEQTTFQITSDE